jgi:general secretion pathway protein B
MSFILDALKRSEAERLRKNPPGIANIAQSNRRKSSSKWMWLVLSLLAVNLVAVAGLIFLFRPEVPATQGSGKVIEHETSAMPAASANAPIGSGRERPEMANVEPEVAVAEPAATPVESSQLVSPTQNATSYDRLESFNDLRAKGQLTLPDLHLDIHVYSAQAADRFVFINTSKYKENAALAEGPVVREITPDGVILDYQGTVFLLPRE